VGDAVGDPYWPGMDISDCTPEHRPDLDPYLPWVAGVGAVAHEACSSSLDSCLRMEIETVRVKTVRGPWCRRYGEVGEDMNLDGLALSRRATHAR
jgi:hypothetical protein